MGYRPARGARWSSSCRCRVGPACTADTSSAGATGARPGSAWSCCRSVGCSPRASSSSHGRLVDHHREDGQDDEGNQRQQADLTQVPEDVPVLGLGVERGLCRARETRRRAGATQRRPQRSGRRRRGGGADARLFAQRFDRTLARRRWDVRSAVPPSPTCALQVPRRTTLRHNQAIIIGSPTVPGGRGVARRGTPRVGRKH